MLSGLCYVFWMFIPAFILFSPKRSDPFLTFHAYQGLAFGIFSSLLSLLALPLLWVAMSVLPTGSMPDGVVTVATTGLSTVLTGFTGVLLVAAALGWSGCWLAVALFLGWQASSGRFLRLPWLGERCEARMAQTLALDARRALQVAVDRHLMPDERIHIIAPITTPEQLQADMDRWAEATAASTAPTWHNALAASEPDAPLASRPVADVAALLSPQPASRPPAASAAPPQPGEARPWRPASASRGAAEVAPAAPERPAPLRQPPAADRQATPWRAPAAQAQPAAPEVTPWRGPTAQPSARPVEGRPAPAAEARPWRPAPAHPPAASPSSGAQQARPVQFPSVSRQPAAEETPWRRSPSADA